MKPKILHVTQTTGGLETILLLLFRHYDRTRFDFHLACPAGTALEASARELGISVHPISMVRRPAPLGDTLALARLVRLIRREQFAIVHGHSAKGGYLARVASKIGRGPKTVYAPQAFSYLSQRGVARSLFLGLERWAVPLTDLVIASSESEKVRAVREVGFSERRVIVIPNSVDFSEAVDNPTEMNGAAPVVLTVGRLCYQKNPEMFVRMAGLVAERRPDVRFAILGAGFAGPLETSVRQMIAQAGLATRVDILSWSPKKESLQLMSRCAVFVLTSRYEGMPNTLLEALMLNKPAVVTDVDGSRDVVENGVGGFVVALDDDRMMADRVIAVLDDSVLSSRLSAAGHTRARELFDVRRNVAELEGVYERLLMM